MQEKSGLGKFWGKVSEYRKKLFDKGFQKKVLSIVNPEPTKDSDFLIDYITRVLLFLFPLYIYENNAIMGISLRDILFGIVIILMAIWGGFRVIINVKDRPFSFSKKTLLVFGSFFLLIICFVVQSVKLSSELPHTYLYIGCFLIIFCMGFINANSRYYLQLISSAYLLIYISIYKYIFTGTATLIGVEKILGTGYKMIPVLLLSCLVNAYLYITEDNENLQKFYLVLLAAGFVTLFLYGDMAAFMIMLLFVMGMQFLRAPSVDFMKKNMILLFLYAFCASNAPLLTYFNAQGISKEFDLEYSIYIDIIIAVAGLFVTSYWEKLPKDGEDGGAFMETFSKWYKRSILLVLTLIAVAFTFGSKGANLSKGIGGKAISGFTTSLWNAVSKSNGEIWHILTVYGLIGIIVLTVLGGLLLLYSVSTFRKEETSEIEKGYILITLLFIAQGFFYQFSSVSTPAYMIFAGLSLCMGRFAVSKEFSEKVAVKEEIFDIEAEENDSEDEVSVIWVPESVKASMIRDQEASKAKANAEKETQQGKNDRLLESFKRYFPQVCSLLLAGFAAVFLLLLSFAIYRLFVPVGSVGGTESLVADAIEERQEELLAEAAAGASDGVLEGEELAEADAEASLGMAEGEADVENGRMKDEENAAGEGQDNEDSDETDEAGEDDETDQSEEETDENGEGEESSEDGEDTEGENEEESEISDEDIPAGVSGGDYRIYDPNARYSAADDTVTGKNGVVNLRSLPSTGNRSVVVHALEEGETAKRTGIGANGWSKVEYGGRTLYAVTDYLMTYEEVAEEEATEEDEAAQAAAEEAARAAAEAEAAAKAQEEAAAAAASKEKPKTPTSYTVQFTNDNKKVNIWSSGHLYGTMTVTDGEGNAVSMTNYGDYYQGSGKNQKRYLNIYAPKGDSELTINVDQGFVDSIKAMGYSGLYFNKTLHNW